MRCGRAPQSGGSQKSVAIESAWSALLSASSAAVSCLKSCAVTAGSTAVGLLLIAPARHLYLDGPHILGCWRGMPLPDVCSGLTNIGAHHWALHPELCRDAIDRHVWSFVVPLYVLAYFGLASRLAWCLGRKIMQ